MLKDQDRIFTNLYGMHDRSLKGAMKRGQWNGTADIIKRAMVNVADRLKREGLRARLVLQVHDELIVETPREETETVKKLLTEDMEGAASLSVQLKVDASVGENW